MGGTRGVDELHHREVLLRGEAELGVEEVHDALPQSRASYAAPPPLCCVGIIAFYRLSLARPNLRAEHRPPFWRAFRGTGKR